jgi:Flp pilus assembly CpaE family ATPase
MSGSISPSVLVACDDLLLLDEVIRYLEEIPQWRLVAPARSAEELLRNAEVTAPDIVLVSDRIVVDLASEPVLAKAGQLGAGFVVFAQEETTDALRAALRLGARGFVLWPQDRLQLKPIVEKGIADETLESLPAGMLHCVWAPKGGAGSSVIAAHLAAGLAKLAKNVVLVDLDLDNADQSSILQADVNAKSLGDLIRLGEELTADMVRSVAWTHSSGFKVVLAPGEYGETSLLKPSQLARALNTIREVAGHVVADLPSGITDLNLSILEQASSIVLVLTPDLLGLRRAREAVRLVRSVGVDTSRMHAVLNQAGGVDISPTDIEQVLEVPKTTRLPADYQIYRMANRGQLSPRCCRFLTPLAKRLGNLQQPHLVNAASSVDGPTKVGPAERRYRYRAGARAER